MTRYGYLGPEGTFTSMALDAWEPAAAAERAAFGSVDAALAALRAGEIDGAMVPIENSVEGGVSATLDALASGEPLVVVGEVLVPITFVLAAPAGIGLARRARRRHALARLGPGARLDGRAPAGRGVRPDAVDRRRRRGPGAGRRSPTTPAVCAPAAARLHGLEVLAEDIGDMQAAVTRFVLVARPGRAARAHRRRQDDRRALPARRPRRWAARAARAVRGARRQHDPARVAPDQGVDGVLLLLHRPRGPRARRAGRRGAHGAAAHLRRGALPRVLPAGRPAAGEHRAAHERRRLRRGPDWLAEVRAGRG